MSKMGLAIATRDFSGMPPMSACYTYGMNWGCDIDCPVLRAGECELKDDDNKELWAEVQAEEAKFEMISCSSCGQGFGPGDSGFSHCESHAGLTPVD